MTSLAKTVSCICGEMPAIKTGLSRVFVALLRCVRDLKRGSVAAIVARVKLPSADQKRSGCAKPSRERWKDVGVSAAERSGIRLKLFQEPSYVRFHNQPAVVSEMIRQRRSYIGQRKA